MQGSPGASGKAGVDGENGDPVSEMERVVCTLINISNDRVNQEIPAHQEQQEFL